MCVNLNSTGSNKENLVVAEWPLASSAIKSAQDGEKDGEKESVQEESSPRGIEVDSLCQLSLFKFFLCFSVT